MHESNSVDTSAARPPAPYEASLRKTRRILFIVSGWFAFSLLVFAPQATPEYRMYASSLKVGQVLLSVGAALALRRWLRGGQIVAWFAAVATIMDFPIGVIAGIAMLFYLVHAAAKGSFSSATSRPN